MDGELEVAEAVTEIAEVQPVTAVAEVPHAVAEEVPHAVAAVAVPHDAAPAPHAVAIATTAAGGTITSAVTDAAAAVRMASALTANAPTLAEAGWGATKLTQTGYLRVHAKKDCTRRPYFAKTQGAHGAQVIGYFESPEQAALALARFTALVS